MLRFASRLIALRKDSRAIKSDSFPDGAPIDETLIPDIEWRCADGVAMREDDWRDDRRKTLVAALYAPPESGSRADRAMIVWHNADVELRVSTPPPRNGFDWTIALATAPARREQDSVVVAARSVTVLRDAATPGRRLDAEAPPELMSALARAAGVAMEWRDADGVEHRVPSATVAALLAALVCPLTACRRRDLSLASLAQREDARALPASAVFRDDEDILLRLPTGGGRSALRMDVTLEHGERRRIELRASDAEGFLARIGRARLRGVARAAASAADGAAHRLAGGNGSWLTIAPRRCHQPERADRAIGLSAQLYSLRRDADQGIGDFTTLSQLGTLGANAGAATIALNPLHALFPGDRERASPYYPSDREFFDPIYLDLARLGDFSDDTLEGVAALRTRATSTIHASMRSSNRRFRGPSTPSTIMRDANRMRRNPAISNVSSKAAATLVSLRLFPGDNRRRGDEDWRRWRAAVAGWRRAGAR